MIITRAHGLKAFKIIIYIIFLIAFTEFTTYLIYEHFLPDPFVQKKDHYILNDKYGFRDFRLSGAKEVIAVEKGSGVLRVFSYGASTTAGWPYGSEYNYTTYLKSLFDAKYPNKKIEVVNLSITGLDSWEILQTVEKSIKYSPDLIMVYTGHNTMAEYNLIKLKLGFFNPFTLYFKNSYSIKLANHYLNLIISKYLLSWSITKSNTRNKVFDSSIISKKEKNHLTKNYSQNVNSMVSICLDRNIKLLILKPIFNMADRGPVHSSFREELSGNKKELFMANLIQGIKLYKNSDYHAALKLFQENLKIDDEVAILHYYIANCHLRNDNLAKAKEHRAKSTDLDGIWSVCPDKYQDVLDNINNDQNIGVVPLSDKIGEMTGVYYLNKNWMFDEIHPKPRLHKAVAHIILKDLVDRKWLPPVSIEANTSLSQTIDIRGEMGDPRYYSLCKNMAKLTYHLSFWSFDPMPLLKESQEYMAKYMTYINEENNTTIDADIYDHLIESELGNELSVYQLTNKWGIDNIRNFIEAGEYTYDHLDGLKEDLIEYEASKQNP